MAQNDVLNPWRQTDAKSPTKPKPTPQTTNGVILFTVYHRPMGAPRMTRRDKWKNRPCVEAYHAFRDAIRRYFPGDVPPAEHVNELSWLATFATSKPELIGTIYRNKPDRDNIDKAILDALWKRDEAIGPGWIDRRWGTEDKLEIRITLLQALESTTKV